jgi:hypothetical protein
MSPASLDDGSTCHLDDNSQGETAPENPLLSTQENLKKLLARRRLKVDFKVYLNDARQRAIVATVATTKMGLLVKRKSLDRKSMEGRQD